jgi:hypothetical protein
MQNHKLIRQVYPPQQPVLVEQSKGLIHGKKKWPNLVRYFGGFKTPIGIEIEAENVQTPVSNTMVYWKEKNDSSLKVNGREFVSIPVAGHNIDYALAEIKEKITDPDILWSHRTSIHVHTQVLDLSVQQFHLLISLYAVFEELFFKMVDPTRVGNGYCYHLRDLSPEQTSPNDQHGKYCALNIGTGLRNFGTVEFRHLQGTSDLRLIRRWIQLIVKLQKYVEDVPSDQLRDIIVSLNTTSQYGYLLNDVFGKSAVLFEGLDLKKAMEDGVIWAKLYLSI